MAAGQAIGVFDSGVGGLTVLHEIAKLLPHENLVYLGDTARVPYGTKSPETVCQYAMEAADFLAGVGVRMLVVACNTASAVALDALQGRHDLPVIGVIEPGAKRAASLTRNARVGVIGTEGTIRSDAYARAIKAVNAGVEVISIPCPLFVPLAEEGWSDHEIARLAAEDYIGSLRDDIDTLVLGCTHYPLLKNTLQKVLGEQVVLVDSAEETAKIVANGSAPPLQDDRRSGTIRFFVTDVPTRFERVGGRFLGRPLGDVHQVSLRPGARM